MLAISVALFWGVSSFGRTKLGGLGSDDDSGGAIRGMPLEKMFWTDFVGLEDSFREPPSKVEIALTGEIGRSLRGRL